MSFEKLGLRAELLRSVSEEGYNTPTPVQTKTIPAILARRDVLAGAQTGTGKTAAFTLPMLQLLAREQQKGPHPRALVLTPTRELAAQVEESVATYGRHLHLRSTVVYGGVGINPQIQKLRRGVDILVATPGRLLDHAGQRTVNLSKVEILVLDEADRMLDMGFIHDIKRVLKLLPQSRQNLLFSATYNDDIRRLADGLLSNPEMIEVTPRNSAVETVEQVVHPVGQSRKRALLSHLIKDGDWRQVLVFTRTKHGANRLAKQLESDGVSASAIHGNKSQAARTRALSDFKRGVVRTLVATDIAARGLDIDGLPHVVNFDLPNVAEDYVHRIGRTGRAGAEGRALSLVSMQERDQLRGIQRLLGRSITVENIPGFESESSEELRQGTQGRDDNRERDRRPGGFNRQRPAGKAKGREGRPGSGQRTGAGHGRRSSGAEGGRTAGGRGTTAKRSRYGS